MKYFTLTNEPRQKFNIPIAGETLQLEMRWLPAVRFWTLSILKGNKIEDEVKGVKVVKDMPILTQYGYPNIEFTSPSPIGRDLSATFLVDTDDS